MNLIIYLFILIISMLFLYIINKLLGKLGLSITYVLMSITSLLLSFKYVTLSTINLNSNSITYVTMLTALYLFLESNDKKGTKDLINLNFLINIFFSIMIYIMTTYTQSLTDTISVNMKNVFTNNSQILIIYPLTTLLSSYLLIWVYKRIKQLYDNHFIAIVTIYLLVGLIEGILYTLLVYGRYLSIKSIIMIILSTYMIRLITTVIYSIFLILLDKKKVISWIVLLY